MYIFQPEFILPPFTLQNISKDKASTLKIVALYKRGKQQCNKDSLIC